MASPQEIALAAITDPGLLSGLELARTRSQLQRERIGRFRDIAGELERGRVGRFQTRLATAQEQLEEEKKALRRQRRRQVIADIVGLAAGAVTLGAATPIAGALGLGRAGVAAAAPTVGRLAGTLAAGGEAPSPIGGALLGIPSTLIQRRSVEDLIAELLAGPEEFGPAPQLAGEPTRREQLRGIKRRVGF